MKFWPGVVPQCPSSRGLMCCGLQRLAQQRIVEQIDLADRQVVGGAPVGVDPREEIVWMIVMRCQLENVRRRPARSSALRRWESPARRPVRPDVEMTGAAGGVALRIEPDAEKLETLADPARTAGACSPMPPENTSVSSPPSAAANAPIAFLDLVAVDVDRQPARRSSVRSRSSRSRMSPVDAGDAEQTRTDG